MLSTGWPPTWVIDGRDTVRAHKLTGERLEVEEEHRLGMLLCSRYQAWGEAWLCATPRSRVAHAARRIVQCAEPGKPPAAYGCRQGTQFPKRGGVT